MVRRRVPPLADPDPSTLRVRDGRAEDAEFVRALASQVFGQFGDYAAFLPPYLTHPSVFTALAEQQGRPLGYVMLALVRSARALPWDAGPPLAEGEEHLDAEVLAIAVEPGLQGRGVGRRLLQHALACATTWQSSVGVRSIQLNVADTNLSARRFFERNGFLEVDPADGTYPKGQRSIRMARKLP